MKLRLMRPGAGHRCIGFFLLPKTLTIFASSKRRETSNALNAAMKGEENIKKYGKDNAAGGLFTHRFAVQMQKLIDKGDEFDKNSDGHTNLVEYENAAIQANKLATRRVSLISSRAV